MVNTKSQGLTSANEHSEPKFQPHCLRVLSDTSSSGSPHKRRDPGDNCFVFTNSNWRSACTGCYRSTFLITGLRGRELKDRFLWALLPTICAAALLRAPSVRAQDSEQGPASDISCTSNAGNGVLLDKKDFRLSPAPPEAVARASSTKPVFSGGPFAAGKYPYERIDVFFAKEKPREGGMYGTETTLAIVVRTKTGEKESWFELLHDRNDRANRDFMVETPADRSSAPDQLGEPSEGVSLALKDSTVPLLALRWFTGMMGGNASTEIDKHVLLDFRKSPPSVMAVLQCVNNDGGGACTTYDIVSAPTTKVECNWDSARGDFLCDSIVSGDFVQPVTRRFYLESGEQVPFQPKPGEPRTLAEFATQISRDAAWAARNPEIPGLGMTAFLGKYTPTGGRGAAYLFASRGRQSTADERFFAVQTDASGATLTEEIIPAPLLEESSPDASEPPGQSERPSVLPATIAPSEMVTGSELSFRVQSLVELPNLNAWQVLATEGPSHEIVWLAADRNPVTSEFVFGAVRIAADSGSYASCGATQAFAFAASVKRTPGKLDAVLDVEPEHDYDLEGHVSDYDNQGNAVVLCSVEVHLTWQPAKGFALARHEQSCPAWTKPRSLKISADGSISTTTPETRDNK
jgi:hypothetical protein